jgi:hypothetical protein
LVSLTDESLTTEQKIERISTMLTNLTESGARAIASAISPAMLSDMGLPSEISATCASLVSSAFLTLADAKANGMSEEQFDREADAMTSMLNLAVSVGKGEHNSSHLFGTDGILGCTADSLLDTVTGSNMISTALLSMVGAGNDAFFTVSNHDPLGIGSLGEADDAALLAAIEHAEQALSSYPSSTSALWSPTNNTVTRQDMARRLCAFASIFGLEYDSEYVDIKQ